MADISQGEKCNEIDTDNNTEVMIIMKMVIIIVMQMIMITAIIMILMIEMMRSLISKRMCKK